DRVDGQRAIGRPGQAWGFMDLEANAVAQTMTERVALAALLNVASGYRVSILSAHASPDAGTGRLVRAAHDRVNRALLIGRTPYHHGARDVGAVAVDDRAEVNQQKIAALHRAIIRARMRERRARTRRHDSLEGKPATAGVTQCAFEQSRDLQFRHPGAHRLQRAA